MIWDAASCIFRGADCIHLLDVSDLAFDEGNLQILVDVNLALVQLDDPLGVAESLDNLLLSLAEGDGYRSS
jgi:hypothetical protein